MVQTSSYQALVAAAGQHNTKLDPLVSHLLGAFPVRARQRQASHPVGPRRLRGFELRAGAAGKAKVSPTESGQMTTCADEPFDPIVCVWIIE